jgi:hypothetical protein
VFVFTPRGRAHVTHWVGPRAGLAAVREKKIGIESIVEEWLKV